ncbi:glycosyl transferase [Pimelobacter simplex]|uniref:glycosyl transferase n=1 Tax=Nocardioides simplex TaxID=2045 RepID=UPI00382D57AB
MSSPAGRPHVLYVAWGFPPMAGGGTYRTLATANTLVEVGFDVTVLTAERASFVGFTGVDPSLEEKIHPSIDVVRIPFERPTADFDVRHWPAERIADPKGWIERYEQQARAEFPEQPFGTWLTPMIAEVDRIHARRPVDLVIGSANPHVVLAAGDHLHRTHGVPHVIDHRDAWRLNCYLGVEVHADEPRVAELETRYMESAHRVWFVNEPIRQWHQALYPQAADKMRVVENGFDPGFAPAPHTTSAPADKPLRFAYIGTIGPRVPVEEFAMGWVEARQRLPELDGARAELFGPMSHVRGRAELVAEAEPFGLHHRGPVAKADVAGVYDDADVLLLVLGAGRFVTSGKVYEYLAAGLPIVSVHEPGNGASDILRDYPLWFPVTDLTAGAIADALGAAARAARDADADLRARAVAFGEKYERSRQLTAPLTELFDDVTSGVRA